MVIVWLFLSPVFQTARKYRLNGYAGGRLFNNNAVGNQPLSRYARFPVIGMLSNERKNGCRMNSGQLKKPYRSTKLDKLICVVDEFSKCLKTASGEAF